MFNRGKDQYRLLENDSPSIVSCLFSWIISAGGPVKPWISFYYLDGCNGSGAAIISFNVGTSRNVNVTVCMAYRITIRVPSRTFLVSTSSFNHYNFYKPPDEFAYCNNFFCTVFIEFGVITDF